MRQNIRLTRWPVFRALALLAASTPTFAASISGLYNTGVNNNGTLATNGTVDGHYALISVPIGATNVAYISCCIPTSYPFPGGWVVVSNAQWLAPAANGSQNEPEGQYLYRFSFNMADSSGNALDPTTAVVTGSWAADDGADLSLNGFPLATNSSNSSYQTLISFNISSHFQNGTNTLDFLVTNANAPVPNPTGLLVANLSGTAQLTSTAPTLSIRLSQVELCWDTGSNTWYQLQYRSSLTTNQWLSLNNNWVSGDGTRFCTNDAILIGQPQRFYQLVVTNSPP